MSTVLSLFVAFCCGVRARFMTCAEAETYFGAMHFDREHGGEDCIGLMLALSGKPGKAAEWLVPSGATYYAARLDG